MTGFLNLDLLRTHAASFDIITERPVLVAVWHVDANGRLICHWREAGDAPDDPG